jgi:hypothetical protein
MVHICTLHVCAGLQSTAVSRLSARPSPPNTPWRGVRGRGRLRVGREAGREMAWRARCRAGAAVHLLSSSSRGFFHQQTANAAATPRRSRFRRRTATAQQRVSRRSGAGAGGAGAGWRWSRWRWAHLHLPQCDSPFGARALAVGQLPASIPLLGDVLGDVHAGRLLGDTLGDVLPDRAISTPAFVSWVCAVSPVLRQRDALRNRRNSEESISRYCLCVI